MPSCQILVILFYETNDELCPYRYSKAKPLGKKPFLKPKKKPNHIMSTRYSKQKSQTEIEKNTRTLHDGNKILTKKRIAFKEYVIVRNENKF